MKMRNRDCTVLEMHQQRIADYLHALGMDAGPRNEIYEMLKRAVPSFKVVESKVSAYQKPQLT